MADRARVTSVEAIEAFRANLIVYLSKVRPTLEEVSNEVIRARQWLQFDQRRHWENELRMRSKKLERAQAELLSATISKLRQASTAQQMEVRKCLEAMQEAREKLTTLKRWDRELENRSEPLLKEVDQLHHYVTTDMPRAVAYLSGVVKTLEAYTDVPMPGSSGTRASAPGEAVAGEASGDEVKPSGEGEPS